MKVQLDKELEAFKEWQALSPHLRIPRRKNGTDSDSSDSSSSSGSDSDKEKKGGAKGSSDSTSG